MLFSVHTHIIIIMFFHINFLALKFSFCFSFARFASPKRYFFFVATFSFYLHFSNERKRMRFCVIRIHLIRMKFFRVSSILSRMMRECWIRITSLWCVLILCIFWIKWYFSYFTGSVQMNLSCGISRLYLKWNVSHSQRFDIVKCRHLRTINLSAEPWAYILTRFSSHTHTHTHTLATLDMICCAVRTHLIICTVLWVMSWCDADVVIAVNDAKDNWFVKKDIFVDFFAASQIISACVQFEFDTDSVIMIDTLLVNFRVVSVSSWLRTDVWRVRVWFICVISNY